MSAQLYGEWKVTLFDESWDFKPDDMRISELVVLEREFGGSIDDLVAGVDDRAPIACQVLIWFLRGRNVDRLTIDFPPRRLTLKNVVDPKGQPVRAESTVSEPALSESSPEPTE